MWSRGDSNRPQLAPQLWSSVPECFLCTTKNRVLQALASSTKFGHLYTIEDLDFGLCGCGNGVLPQSRLGTTWPLKVLPFWMGLESRLVALLVSVLSSSMYCGLGFGSLRSRPHGVGLHGTTELRNFTACCTGVTGVPGSAVCQFAAACSTCCSTRGDRCVPHAFHAANFPANHKALCKWPKRPTDNLKGVWPC